VSGSYLGLMIEGLVAILLVVTISYCVVLNRRLKRLRADEASLRATIIELVHATEIAEKAIAGFRETAAECDRNLANKLRQADRFSRSIEKQVELGGKVLNRLSRISELARTHGLVERAEAPAAHTQAADPADHRPEAQPVGRAPAAAGQTVRVQAGEIRAMPRPEQARPPVDPRQRVGLVAGRGGRAA
jgi:hypothetical protein